MTPASGTVMPHRFVTGRSCPVAAAGSKILPGRADTRDRPRYARKECYDCQVEWTGRRR
ncbi:hypothetical protein Nm8I071_21650 [Nonomuraea sp. TT08I-71]|nr:hypothetical protein Nm8I071_21650 [Nonomuraea sp. TT08I-71]